MSKDLVTLFRSGSVPRKIRLAAAKGELPLAPEEQKQILEQLAADEDESVRLLAHETLSRISAPPPPAPAPSPPAEDLPEPLQEPALAPEAPPDGEIQKPPAEGQAQGEDRPQEESETFKTTLQKISKMNVGERMKVAGIGSREERMILVRDTNRLVSTAVLKSPKITDRDVEIIATFRNVSEEVLREIGNNREWTSSYSISLNLVRNPKTPIGVSMRLIQRLTTKDLRLLQKDRSLQEILRRMSVKMVADREKTK
ncbi:MAG: hypothetical protein HY652_12465 [Acidobacteria bacterium]|nr:hypothetical protein [Acidobacteriota bacterium]